MSDTPLQRPPQVMILGGAILVGSAFVVMLAFERISTLGTIEAQEQADLFVREGLGRGLGVTADGWQSVLRVLCVVAGGTAVVTGFLGFQVLQRVRSSRLVLSLLAPVLLIAGTATADLIATLVIVAIALLWRQPARDWLDGKAVPPPAPRQRLAAPAPPATPSAPATTHPAQQAVTWPAPPPATERPTERPRGLVTAAAITIVTSGIVIAGAAVGLLYVVTARADFESELADQIASQPAYQDLDIDVSVVTDVFIGVLIAFAVWAVVAIVLAVLAARGSNGARIALLVSAIGAGLASLLGVLAVLPLAIAAACVVVSVLLMRADTGAWFAARRGDHHS